jgi:hypothetical protein
MSLASFANAGMVSVVRAVLRFVPLLLLLLGCDACGNTSSTVSETAVDPADPVNPSDPTSPSDPPPSDAPRVIVRGTPNDPGRLVAIAIENHAEAAVSLSRELVVEVQRGDSWSTVTTAGLSLRSTCEAEAPECVTLQPGAELYPPEWLGTQGDAQCICTRCVPVESGTYRFVVTTCEGARIEGEPFAITR